MNQDLDYVKTSNPFIWGVLVKANMISIIHTSMIPLNANMGIQ